MAPKPPAVGVAKITWTFLCSGKNYTDSFYVSKAVEAPWTLPELNAAASTASAAWDAFLSPLASNTCSLVDSTAMDLSSDTGLVVSHAGIHAGTVADSPPLPLNAVARITWEVGRRYRGGHPGINVSGRVQSQLADERVFNDADADALLNAMVETISTVVAACPTGSFQCALSYFVAGAPRLVPVVYRVVGAEIQKRLCTLRKRLGKPAAELLG